MSTVESVLGFRLIEEKLELDNFFLFTPSLHKMKYFQYIEHYQIIIIE